MPGYKYKSLKWKNRYYDFFKKQVINEIMGGVTMNDMLMGCTNVISISSVCNGELRQSIIQSDYIRNETLNRLCSMPGYKYKSLKWKNRYYDYFKKQVINEMEGM
jgi:hypothetical protein